MQQCSSYDHMRRICSSHLCRESSSLVLSNSNALAETANVQSGGKLAIKTKFNGSFNHRMLAAFSVSSLTTKFTCLLSSRNLPLYCCLNSCIQASTCSVETLLGRLFFKVLMARPVSNFRTWLEESSGSALRFLPRCPSTGKAPDDPGFFWTTTGTGRLSISNGLTGSEGETSLRELGLGSKQLFRPSLRRRCWSWQHSALDLFEKSVDQWLHECRRLFVLVTGTGRLFSSRHSKATRSMSGFISRMPLRS